ncbi:tetratricopeptide repeat protein [Leptospira ilyithenensis]|uniref:Tetratricopeptide repeat protein n=1 Tax=Leptospira ilyithenensis TaxID=2484901 RepID=A0A4V3JXF4_9LEPT|nr:tetratricopeptide repeat protein [Leptospira ilyithenensis]TGN10867.1 tetratricopeptide repeat protein [Leptospira ilyithenensis]
MDFKKQIIFVFLMIEIVFLPSLSAESITDAIQLMEKSEYQKSTFVLDTLVRQNPNDSVAWMYKGYANMMLGHYDFALTDYQTSYRIHPNLDSLSGIQWALLAMGKYKESIETGATILKDSPNNYYATLRTAEAYYTMQEYSEAYDHYNSLHKEHEKDGYSVWKKGLCEYYLGNIVESVSLFKEADKLLPNHPGIQYSITNTRLTPFIAITPEAAGFQFRGSDFLGNGQKGGINITYSPNDDWNFRIGASTEQTQNLNSSTGVQNYLFDPLSLISYNQYKAALPQSTVRDYLILPLNLYYLDQLLSAKDYQTQKYSGGITYRLSEHFYTFASTHVLQSNTSYLDGGTSTQAGISYTDYYTISFSGTGISHPTSKGGQTSLAFYIPFLDGFYSNSTATGQQMSVKDYETVYLSLNPLYTTYQTTKESKGYGFFQQELGYKGRYFFTGIGGRVGSARTPMMGEAWVYTGMDMLNGGYGFIGAKYKGMSAQVQYYRDYWLDSQNNKPVSDSVRLSLTWIF